MKFEQALEAMRQGKKAKRAAILHPIFILDRRETGIKSGFGYMTACSSVRYRVDLDNEDILAEDWEIIND